MTETATATRTLITTLPAWMLHADDVILYPQAIAGEEVPDTNPLAVVVAVGECADPYLDDAEPVTLITADENGSHLIDHVEPQRRFHVARRVAFPVGEYPGGDYVEPREPSAELSSEF